jgi:D-alanyl-D-alanine carboxypeptidase
MVRGAWSHASRSGIMHVTKRPLRQARPIPARRRRIPRARPRLRAPVATLLLTLLAFLAPDLTLAPNIAVQPAAITATAVDPDAAAPSLGLEPNDRRTAGWALPQGAAPSPSADPPSRPDPEAFERALGAARARGGAHGVSFAVVRDGELLWSGSSGRARDARTTLDGEAPMVIGSVTKTFVAAAALQLVEEGRLGLDDRVRDHLPELRRLSRRITVAQLLDHTSGLADLFNDTTRRGLEDDPAHAWTADEVLGSLRSPWYEPGEGWAYANTNYYLLGMIVERLSEASLAEVLGERFLEPLGLDGTRVLTGVEGDPLEPAWTTIFWASGAMAAPASDLARWGDALYRGGVLDPASRAAMLTMNRHHYGYGVQEIEIGRRTGYGHTGLLNTYTSLLLHLPDEGLTLALLVNRSHVDLAAMLRAKPAGGSSLLNLALGDQSP